jgi:hypothetical protein
LFQKFPRAILYKKGEACSADCLHSSNSSTSAYPTFIFFFFDFSVNPNFTTMKSIIASAVVALSALMAQAANHVVSVGAGGALAYSPNNVVAAVGDTITFQFLAGVTPLSSPSSNNG